MVASLNSGNLQIEAKYAGHTYDFGYFLEFSPTTFNTAISAASPGETGILGNLAENFYFGIYDRNSQKYWSSTESDNAPGGYDHMVTHQILDSRVDFHYAIAFEDLNLGDQDYNDLVFDVQWVRPFRSVPEPATMLLLGTGLIDLAGLGRKKYFKK